MIGSFDKFGFLRRQKKFNPQDIPQDLSGKRYLITGANSGIGFATASALAARRAEVWLLCRDKARGEEAQRKLKERSPEAKVVLSLVDMSSLGSIRAFAEGFSCDSITGLVHNAGLMPDTRQLSPEGFEVTFAAHVVGPHLLTRLLLPRLAAGRVVLVSSGGMYTKKLDLNDLRWDQRSYDGVNAYAQTKRMQVVLAELWSEREKSASFLSMHPGWAETPAVQSSMPRFYKLTKGILRTPEQGADTLIWLVAGPSQTSGGFWFDREQRSTHYLPWTKESALTREALWQLLEQSIKAPLAV
jgi:dehydrogenase/reductase SDR family protein 12